MDASLFSALVASSCLAAIGQLLLKLGVSGQTDRFSASHILLGLAAYAAGLVLWLYGLSRAPLHVVYPFSLLTFVIVGVLGIVALGERPNVGTAIGWGVVIVGIAIIYYYSARITPPQ